MISFLNNQQSGTTASIRPRQCLVALTPAQAIRLPINLLILGELFLDFLHLVPLRMILEEHLGFPPAVETLRQGLVLGQGPAAPTSAEGPVGILDEIADDEFRFG